MTPDPIRILVADDLVSIHEDYRKILSPVAPSRPPFAGFEDFAPDLALETTAVAFGFDLECVTQGEDAVRAVQDALAARRPFAVAFLDVRMPPGIDGVEAAQRLRALDPELQIVLCSAYSDHALTDVARRFPESDGLLILKKPFDPVEVQQLARSLGRKWQLAAEHQALLGNLERRVEHRTAELTAARAELETAVRKAESASRAKSEFLANMSHEIRTPLNAVVGMAELLQGTALTDQQREFADTIRGSGDTLLAAINEILDFCKIERDDLAAEREPFDLRACLHGALNHAAHPSAAGRIILRHEIAADLPAHVVGDRQRLRQVLFNLVSNAIKFTERGEVVLTAVRRVGPDGAPRMALAVRDTGIGIPAERHDRLFQAFSQVDASATRKYGGTGLGLAIAQRLVSLMGGRIEVDSAPGRGSVFHFDLPLLAAPATVGEPVVPAIDPAFAQHLPLRILLVEDNPVNQRVAQLMLRKMGYAPAFAVNGLEALDAVAREPFDVLLLDVQMPLLDGLETARRLCATYPARRRPWLIAMTANALAGDREDCLAAGIDDYTSKPVRAQVVAEALTRGAAALAARRAAPE
jgi:signal transduction histidine kinase